MKYYKMSWGEIIREDVLSEILDLEQIQCETMDEFIEAALKVGSITNIYELTMGPRGFYEIQEVAR